LQADLTENRLAHYLSNAGDLQIEAQERPECRLESRRRAKRGEETIAIISPQSFTKIGHK
jgi:hypothetical protein